MPKPFNEDNAACRLSLEKIAAVEADVLLAGHGEPGHGSPAAAVDRAIDRSSVARVVPG